MTAMALHRCLGCNTRVPRARLCVRCGAPQPPRVLRHVLLGTGLGAVVIAIGMAFHSLEAAVPEYRPPRPSDGQWAREEEFGPDDVRPNVPSIFSSLYEPDAGL